MRASVSRGKPPRTCDVDRDAAFRAAAERSGEGIAFVGGDGVVRWVNDAWLRMHGYRSAVEVIGKPIADFVGPSIDGDGDGDDGRISHHVRRDGSRFEASTVAAPVAGNATVQLVEDPQQRKPASDLVAGANPFLDAILDNIPSMVFVKEAKELRFVRYSTAGMELVGHPRADLLGKNDFDFFPEAEARFFVAQDRAALASEEVVDIPEEPIHTRTRGLRWLHTKKIAIRDEHGEPRFLLGLSEDVTERRRSEARLRVLAETGLALSTSFDVPHNIVSVTRALVPSLADGAALWYARGEGAPLACRHVDRDRQDLLTETCRALAVQVARGTTEGVIGRPFLIDAERLPPGLPDFARRLIEAMHARSAILVPIAARGVGIGYLMMWFDVSADRRYDDDDLDFAEKLGQRAGFDIDNAILYGTLEKAQAQAQVALRTRDEFLSIASHELRTPLSSLQLALQRLDRLGREDAISPVELAKMVTIATRQVGRLGRLLDDLLDVSRIIDGRLILQREDVDLGDAVSNVVEQQREEARSRGCELRFTIGTSTVGHWDSLRVEQVVTNLLSNATKYAPRRPVDIHIDVDGDDAVLRVRDHGKGIPEASLERVFGRFERAVSSRSFGGLGLGLYITRQIVEAHGGTIVAHNAEGGGAELIVTLPRRGAGRPDLPPPSSGRPRRRQP